MKSSYMNKFYKSAILMAAGAMLLSCHKEIDAPVPNRRPEIPEEPAIVDAQFAFTRTPDDRSQCELGAGCQGQRI